MWPIQLPLHPVECGSFYRIRPILNHPLVSHTRPTLIKQLNITSLAALHDLNLAAQYCDRVFMLQDGAVVASGTPEHVLQPALIRSVYHVDAHVEQHAVTQQLHVFLFPLTRTTP
jgi:ABC-type cobalamin/Fe3+-siderophores transport system ATPase subunit